MGEKETVATRHASERIVNLDIDLTDLEKLIREGERIPEGKDKTRYRLRTKKGLLIAICIETPEQITIITVMKRR